MINSTGRMLTSQVLNSGRIITMNTDKYQYIMSFLAIIVPLIQVEL
jgi:hypothetical protein